MICRLFVNSTFLTMVLIGATACDEAPSQSKSVEVEAMSINAANSINDSIDVDSAQILSRSLMQVDSASGESTEAVMSSRKVTSNSNKITTYNLENPSQVCNLPKELVEISALAYDPGTQKLIAVNDEKANIYYLNSKHCVVAEKIDFGSKGDYEGIEKVGKMIYVLEANGDIIAVNKNKPKSVKTYRTPLSSKNDVEGLGYDEVKNELILACKGAPEIGKGKKLKDSKAFYAFDLATNTLNDKPIFVITDKALRNFFKENREKSLSKKEKKKLEKRLESFAPSGIAKHPVTGFYYVLSSVGRLLVICDDAGNLEHVHFLKSKVFIQPEGICFAPDGTMFISNEGRSLVGKVMRFGD